MKWQEWLRRFYSFPMLNTVATLQNNSYFFFIFAFTIYSFILIPDFSKQWVNVSSFYALCSPLDYLGFLMSECYSWGLCFQSWGHLSLNFLSLYYMLCNSTEVSGRNLCQSRSMCHGMGLQTLETSDTSLENSLYYSVLDGLPVDFKGLCAFHQKGNKSLGDDEEKDGDRCWWTITESLLAERRLPNQQYLWWILVCILQTSAGRCFY